MILVDKLPGEQYARLLLTVSREIPRNKISRLEADTSESFAKLNPSRAKTSIVNYDKQCDDGISIFPEKIAGHSYGANNDAPHR